MRRTHRSFFNQTFINGQWVSSQSGETFQVYNPATGESLGSVPDCNVHDAENAIQAAHKTFHQQWSTKTGKERSVILRKFNDLILKNKNKLANILTTEMVISVFQREDKRFELDLFRQLGQTSARSGG